LKEPTDVVPPALFFFLLLSSRPREALEGPASTTELRPSHDRGTTELPPSHRPGFPNRGPRGVVSTAAGKWPGQPPGLLAEGVVVVGHVASGSPPGPVSQMDPPWRTSTAKLAVIPAHGLANTRRVGRMAPAKPGGFSRPRGAEKRRSDTASRLPCDSLVLWPCIPSRHGAQRAADFRARPSSA
jgi:hypothetical protein